LSKAVIAEECSSAELIRGVIRHTWRMKSRLRAQLNLNILNPLTDDRWIKMVAHHPRASVFHHRGWLEALSRTYGYQPLVLTTSTADESLSNGFVLCRVSSWITGTRLVSLPFADHCDPLVNDIHEYRDFMNWMRMARDLQRYKYVEFRPLSEVQGLQCGLQPSHSYCFHELDITKSLEQIFREMHKDSIQRKIRRAEREKLSYEAARSEELVDDFFRLLLLTRRRHQLPPQPRVWFRNLAAYMGDRLTVRLARKENVPIAALVTLRHQSSVVYKYGCSNEKFHNLGAVPFLFWRLIEEGKASGVETIDFGRSDLDNQGLIAFKDRFGARKKLLTYYRYPGAETGGTLMTRGSQAVRQLLSILPDAVLSTAGRVLYRHMG
jgi:CelD/BcsL family acetyltransferase involved in cellulose biosynthesis